MRDFLKNFPFREFSVFITIVGSFTYNVLLDRDVVCTCIDVATDCRIYLFMPGFIIFFLILWTDKILQRTCNYYIFVCSEKLPSLLALLLKKLPLLQSRRPDAEQQDQQKNSNCRGALCGVFVSRLIKAFCIGVLWAISVLIDGDWYVCCQNDQSEKQSQLACKDKTNMTAEENVVINTLKNKSRVSFFLTLFISYNAVLSQQTLLKSQHHLIIIDQATKEIYK